MSNDGLTALMQEHADGEETFGDAEQSALKGVTNLAQRWLDETQALAAVNTEATEIKQRIKVLEENDIPEMMADAKLKTFELEDGSKINLKDEVFISIKADSKEAAFQWLGANGHGSIVKHVIAVQFGKGEDADAETLRTLLEANGIKYSDGESVHAGTLKSWAKEEIENGRMPPEEFFNLYEITLAKIKPAK